MFVEIIKQINQSLTVLLSINMCVYVLIIENQFNKSLICFIKNRYCASMWL